MALAADRPYETSGELTAIRVKLTTGSTYYKGGLINVTAAGGLGVKASDTANQGSLTGVLVQQKVAVSGDDLGELEIGKVWIPFASAAQADVWDYCYATADDTIAKAAANADPIGRIVDVRVGISALVDLSVGVPKTALA